LQVPREKAHRSCQAILEAEDAAQQHGLAAEGRLELCVSPASCHASTSWSGT
jgi:hypothetical protein